MNDDEVLQVIASAGVAENVLTCDQLTRLYTTMIAQLSPTLGRDQLFELLGFGGLLYSRAFEDFKNEAKLRKQMDSAA